MSHWLHEASSGVGARTQLAGVSSCLEIWGSSFSAAAAAAGSNVGKLDKSAGSCGSQSLSLEVAASLSSALSLLGSVDAQHDVETMEALIDEGLVGEAVPA